MINDIDSFHCSCKYILRFQRKPNPFNQQRQEDLNEYDLRQRVPHYIQTVIQDMNLLRRLLEGGLLNNENQAADYEHRIGLPTFNQPINTARYGPIQNERLVPA